MGFLGLNSEKVSTLLSPVNPSSPGTPSYLSIFLFNNFIYVFVFGCAGSSLLLGLSLAAVRGDSSSLCAGFCGAFLAVEHRLWRVRPSVAATLRAQ